MMTPAAAISSPRGLLAAHFVGSSWDRWRIVLKAAWGELLTADEVAQFREVTSRNPPTMPVSELVCIVGRDAGKDSAASAIATVKALDDYEPYLRPGEVPVILCLAVDRAQASILLGYIRGYFATIPALRQLVVEETDDGLRLSNRVEIVVATNSFRSIRGRTVVAVVFDEVAFWRDENAANPAEEVYAAIAPSLARVPGSICVLISSPFKKSGLLYRRWREAYGRDDPDTLVVRGATRLFNPLVKQSVIERALARDREAASAEWLAEWRSDLADFIDPTVAEALVDRGVHERPPAPSTFYSAFLDLAGGQGGDGLGFSIAHRADDGAAVQDVLRCWMPPFDPQERIAECVALAGRYGVCTILADNWGGGLAANVVAGLAATLDQAARPKTKIYLDFLALANSGKVRLLDNDAQFRQLVALERRTRFGGGETIDHPAGVSAHDDAINAAAGALVAAASGVSSDAAIYTRLGLLGPGQGGFDDIAADHYASPMHPWF